MRRTPFLLLALLVIASSCKKRTDPVPGNTYGSIVFSIEHVVNGQQLKENELIYTNAAGNHYMISDLAWFISDITFYRHDGTRTVIGETKDIFYVNEDIPETKTMRFADAIPAGVYDSVTLIFGISEAKNISYIFQNPPESDMSWPEVLGGGYHNMMMNGKWKDTTGMVVPFNFHLGTGQLYHGSNYNVDSIYAFIPNSFAIVLPGSSFELADKQQLTLRLTMHIDRWFDNPHQYDHNFWGGAIMQNQPAMQMVKENGWDVFSVTKY